eukprot:835963-Prymnesium_polylepis.1
MKKRKTKKSYGRTVRGGRESDRKGGTKEKEQAAKRERLAAEGEAGAEELAEYAAGLASPEPEQELTSPQTTVAKRDTAQEARRRESIVYHFVLRGEPPEHLWRYGMLAEIADLIELPKDKNGKRDYRVITTVLKHYLNKEPLAWHGGGSFELAKTAAHGGARRGRLRHLHGEVGAGVELCGAHCAQGPGGGAVTQKRGTTSTGNRDVDSPWAVSGLAQCEQFTEQIVVPPREQPPPDPALRFKVQGVHRAVTITSNSTDPLGLLSKDVLIHPFGSWWPGQPPALRKQQWPCLMVGFTELYEYPGREVAAAYIIRELSQNVCYPMRFEDVRKLVPKKLLPKEVGTTLGRIPLESVWWTDEKHCKQELGSYATKWETRIPRRNGDPNGEYLPLADGGMLPPRCPRPKAKRTTL